MACGMGSCACEAWFLEGIQRCLERRWEKTDDLSHGDDSSIVVSTENHSLSEANGV